MAATAWTTTAHPLQVVGLSTVIRRKSWWNNWATVTGSYNLVQSMISYSILILCWYFVDFFVLSRTTRWSSIDPSTCRFSTNIHIMRYHLNYLNAAANIKDSHRQYYVFKSGSIVVEWVCVCDAASSKCTWQAASWEGCILWSGLANVTYDMLQHKTNGHAAKDYRPFLCSIPDSCALSQYCSVQTLIAYCMLCQTVSNFIRIHCYQQTATRFFVRKMSTSLSLLSNNMLPRFTCNYRSKNVSNLMYQNLIRFWMIAAMSASEDFYFALYKFTHYYFWYWYTPNVSMILILIILCGRIMIHVSLILPNTAFRITPSEFCDGVGIRK